MRQLLFNSFTEGIMDQVLEQIISAIEPMDLAKTAECYQRLASLTIRQDSKLSYLAGRIAGVQGTLHPEKLQKAVVVFAADHAVDGGENKTKGKNSKADAMEIATGRGLSIRWPTASVPASCSSTWDWKKISRNRRAYRI